MLRAQTCPYQLLSATVGESQSGNCQRHDTELPLCPGTACTRGSLKRRLEIRIKMWVKMARLPYRKGSANSRVLFARLPQNMA